MTASDSSTGPGAAQIEGVGQIAINVHDLDRARAFYRDALGLAHLFDAPDLAFFDAGGVRLMLAPAEKPEFDHPASIVYYRVADARVSYERMRETVEFIEQPTLVHQTETYELWIAFLRDPEGNPLALMSEIPKT